VEKIRENLAVKSWTKTPNLDSTQHIKHEFSKFSFALDTKSVKDAKFLLSLHQKSQNFSLHGEQADRKFQL
jgi:hypothetical protein